MYYTAPPSHKLKSFLRIGSAVFVLLVLIISTAYLLSDAKKKSRDAIRLSGIAQLRSDLGLFFAKYSRYPQEILYEMPDDKKKCEDYLCLDYRPADPSSGAVFAYAPCEDAALKNCSPDTINPQAYTLKYTLESNIGQTPRGRHFASPQAVCADQNCR